MTSPNGPSNDWFVQYGQSVSSPSSTSTGGVPVDNSGMLQIWDLPKYLTVANAPKIWFDTTTTPKPQGVPRNAELGMGPDTAQSKDNLKSPVEVMKQFAALSQSDPTQFAAIQKMLAEGRWYGSSSTIYGGWNAQTERALRDAMVQYLKVSRGSGTPVTFTDFLANTAAANKQLGNTPNGSSSGGTAAQPAGPSLTDTSQLRLQVEEAAQSALGRNLSQKEVSAFVNEFHSRETKAFAAAQAGGQAYVNPDPSTSAAQFVEQNNGVEAKQQDASAYVDSFLNMFLSGSSAAPSRTLDPALTA